MPLVSELNERVERKGNIRLAISMKVPCPLFAGVGRRHRRFCQRFSAKALRFGVLEKRIEGGAIRASSPAKTVADCFRFRNKTGLDVAVEALRESRQHRTASTDELWEAAKVCRVANVMKPYNGIVSQEEGDVLCAPQLNQANGCEAISHDLPRDRLDIVDRIFAGDIDSPGFHDNRAVDYGKIMLTIEFCCWVQEEHPVTSEHRSVSNDLIDIGVARPTLIRFILRVSNDHGGVPFAHNHVGTHKRRSPVKRQIMLPLNVTPHGSSTESLFECLLYELLK
jgi:hypothetical protein